MGEGKGLTIAVAVILMVLPSVTVPLRFVARSKKKAPIGPDDLLIVPALVVLIGMCACQIVATTMGSLGQHQRIGPSIQPVADPPTVTFLKMQYVVSVLQNFSNGLTKMSILFLYRRIFRGAIFDWVSKALIFVTGLWTAGFLLPSIFQCHPISAYWGPAYTQHAQCFYFLKFYLGYAISDTVTDVMILSMPVFIVRKLHMPIRRKVAVSGIFLLGAFVVVVGIVKVCVFFDCIRKEETSADVAYYAAQSWYWTMVETAIGIICACLPTLNPLLSEVSMKSLIGTLKSAFSRQSLFGSRKTKRSGFVESQDAHGNFGTSVVGVTV